MKSVEVFTDGGCIGNPGRGAWAYLIKGLGEDKSSSGFSAETTNNKMELEAVIQSLIFLSEDAQREGFETVVYTDSQYVKNGITTWIHAWLKNGWKTASKDPVKNQDLWKRLLVLQNTLKPRWQWLKGHAGHPENEFCDALVQSTIKAN